MVAISLHSSFDELVRIENPTAWPEASCRRPVGPRGPCLREEGSQIAGPVDNSNDRDAGLAERAIEDQVVLDRETAEIRLEILAEPSHSGRIRQQGELTRQQIDKAGGGFDAVPGDIQPYLVEILLCPAAEPISPH